MKKIIKLTFTVLVALLMIGTTVYAALDCTVSMQTSKTEFIKNEEFIVSVNLSNIQSEKGVIAFGATLEYDKDSLTLVKMEGKNSWSTPSYNEANGKLVMDRSDVTNNDETVLQITFKVKENSKQNTTITLKDISISDSTTPIKKISSINKDIIIKEATTTNQDSSSNSTTDTDTNQNQGSTNNKNVVNSNGNTVTNTITNTTTNTTTNTIKKDVTASNGNLPKTGTNNIIKLLLIFSAIIAIIFYIKLIKIRKN